MVMIICVGLRNRNCIFDIR